MPAGIRSLKPTTSDFFAIAASIEDGLARFGTQCQIGVIIDTKIVSHYIPGRKEVAVMDQPKTLTVPEAGRRYFDLGRNASYEAARRGDIPTIRIGRLLRVPVVARLDRLSGSQGTQC